MVEQQEKKQVESFWVLKMGRLCKNKFVKKERSSARDGEGCHV